MNSPLLNYCGVQRKTTMSVEILPRFKYISKSIWSLVWNWYILFFPTYQLKKKISAIDKNCHKSRAAYNRNMLLIRQYRRPNVRFWKKLQNQMLEKPFIRHVLKMKFLKTKNIWHFIWFSLWVGEGRSRPWEEQKELVFSNQGEINFKFYFPIFC